MHFKREKVKRNILIQYNSSSSINSFTMIKKTSDFFPYKAWLSDWLKWNQFLPCFWLFSFCELLHSSFSPGECKENAFPLFFWGRDMSPLNFSTPTYLLIPPLLYPRGGHSNGKRGYQARPWTHKNHPNHVIFRYGKNTLNTRFCMHFS